MMNCTKTSSFNCTGTRAPATFIGRMSLVEMIKRHGPPAIERLMLLWF